MIRIERKRVKEPERLRSSKTKSARQRLEKFFAEDPKSRGQKDAPFDASIYGAKEVRRALQELSHAKCAYCETPVADLKFSDVDQFRPKIRAINLDGSLTPDGYWWLAYDWDNLFMTCRHCNRFKGSRFPIQGTRATAGTRGTALLDERPLLLNPCDDDPQQHLVFSLDGKVSSSTDRGRTTIDMLGLNRDSLVQDRRRALEQLKEEVGTVLAATHGVDSAMMQRIAGDEVPFAAARRQLIAALMQEAGVKAVKRPAGSKAVPLPSISVEQREHAVSSFRAAQQVQESFSVADAGSNEKYFARNRQIERIEIHNFRPIEDLTLAFPETAVTPDAGATRSPWFMLLGENGAGKSSILQAVALTLIGEKWRNQFNFDASRFVRRGADEGYVRITMAGIDQPVTLGFSSRSKSFTSEPKEPKFLLLGYGSTRLLPRPDGRGPKTSYDFARIDNLFDPFEPLNDAAAWLMTLEEDPFDAVARGLRSILQLGPDDRLTREHGFVEAVLFGSRVTLDELSDGYQSVVALATDIMRVMLHKWPAMEIAEGIVLLDEIGSHLHPRWRMRIVGALRDAFPRIQFVVSTHDPLCLRGLGTGEVAVVARDGAKRVYANTDLPPIAGLRVDQLLTSEYFGMNSTIDPTVEDLFAEYYGLLALRKPSKDDRTRLDQLRTQLAGYRMLGVNQRDRLMLEAIDQYLADQRASPSGDRVQLKAATKKKLAKIWAETPAAPVPPGGRAV